MLLKKYYIFDLKKSRIFKRILIPPYTKRYSFYRCELDNCVHQIWGGPNYSDPVCSCCFTLRAKVLDRRRESTYLYHPTLYLN